MENPFEDLKNKRELIAQKAKQEADKQKVGHGSIRVKRQEAFQQCSEMVMEVLEQLRLSVYPDCEITYDGRANFYWKIFRPKVGYDDNDISILSVSVQINANNEPYLRCVRDSRYKVKKKSFWGTTTEWVSKEPILTGLSREGLVLALKKMHPIDEL